MFAFQYNQITTTDSLNPCFFFFFCLITQAPLRQILTIFSFFPHTASSTARYLWQQHIGQCRSEKKYVWPAQSQNNSWKQQLHN